ncbi:hypothetical protein QJQ45_007398 [Haematococcus lacustris]|nr:hypothetical protein QJQ45_007398 [Haematococcus lacustris]
MVMVPQGVISAVYPETPITTQQLGINIFDGFYRMETLASLTTKRFKVAGPYRQPGDNRLYTTVSAPVLFANVSSSETWGIPYTIDDCPVGLCYDTVTRTKLWGSVAITLDVDAIITDSNNRSILQQLTDSGLQYRLKAPSFGNDSLTATIYESTDGDMSSSSLCTRIAVVQDQWELCVWVKDWRPSYTVPLLVVLVLVAVLLSSALTAVLLSRHEHRALLRSLLPEEAIQKLQANFDWAADAMDENKPQAMLESGTPAEMILSIMGDIVVGRAPALPKVMAVRHTLQQSLDVYQPLQADLSTRIAQTENIDSEVHEALMVQLMGRKAKAEPEEGEDTFNTEAFGKGEGGATPAPATTRARGRGSRTSVPRITATAAPAAGQAAASAAAPISPTKPFKLGAAGPDPGSVSPPKAAVPQPGSNHGAHQASEAKHTAGTGSGQGPVRPPAQALPASPVAHAEAHGHAHAAKGGSPAVRFQTTPFAAVGGNSGAKLTLPQRTASKSRLSTAVSAADLSRDDADDDDDDGEEEEDSFTAAARGKVLVANPRPDRTSCNRTSCNRTGPPGAMRSPHADDAGAAADHVLSSLLMHIMAHQQTEVQPPGSGVALLASQGDVVLLDAGRLITEDSLLSQATTPHPDPATLPLSMRKLPQLKPVTAPMAKPLQSSNSVGPGSTLARHEGATLQTASSQVVITMPSAAPSRQQLLWAASTDTTCSNMELPVQLPAMSQVESCLSSANSWAFDAFQLTSATAGRPLSVLAYWLLHQSGLAAWAHLDHTKLARWLCRIEDGYCANPYHNRSHAADVVQTMHMLLTRGGLMPGYADRLTQLAAYLAAVCHDYQHIGRTNDWLVETQDELALRYNDRSPMENHHLAGAFSLLKHPDMNFLQAMPKATYDRLRKLVIELVLGTDMKQHFSIMGSFTAMHRTAPAMLSRKQSTLGLGRTSHGVSPSELSISSSYHAASVRGSCESHSPKDGKNLQPSSDQDKLLSLQMALKCSDLGHLAAPLPVHLAWVSRLEAEFFAQGDAERAQGLTISPLCDRTKQGITKSQVGFFDFVALPLFNNFTARFTAAKPLLRGVMANYRHWQIMAAAAAEAAAEDGDDRRTGGGMRKA